MLSEQEYYVNAIIAHYRARVEHVNARIKAHGIFQTPFRGSLFLLQKLLTVSIQTTSVYTHLSLCYPPFGPWKHVFE